MSKHRSSRRNWGTGADWQPWMTLAGRTTFNLLGGHGAAPDILPADRALALAHGDPDPLGCALALGIVTMSGIAWDDVLRLGERRLRRMVAEDRRLRAVLEDPARAKARLRVVLAHAFSNIVLAQDYPQYRRGARFARMRTLNYIALYEATRAWLQTLADEVVVGGQKQLACCA